jgi:hypothetical protein
MVKDDTFQAYATEKVSYIPFEKLQYLIVLFIKESAITMGTEVSEAIIERIIYFVKQDFGFLPISYVASAFVKGSTGRFGAGRLVPRTVISWLLEISEDYRRAIMKQQQDERFRVPDVNYDLNKFPVGKAIVKKLEWYEAGLLQGDDWDKISLQELTEAIGKGEHIEFAKFFQE